MKVINKADIIQEQTESYILVDAIWKQGIKFRKNNLVSQTNKDLFIESGYKEILDQYMSN